MMNFLRFWSDLDMKNKYGLAAIAAIVLAVLVGYLVV